RFAARVQQALDAGSLDPAIVDEIMSLPSGALYFARSKKPRKNKVKPIMHQLQLSGLGCKLSSGGDGCGEAEKRPVDWKDMTPIAVSKLRPPPNKYESTEPIARPSPPLPPPSGPTTPISSGQSYPNTPASPPPADYPPTAITSSPVAHVAPPTDRLALSVFISMPSPLLPTKNYGDEDMKCMLPDICFGVTEVDVVE
ncbi:hypothetical protein FRC10_009481, partial [Ceratobasidium sp. 414]